MRSAAPAPRVIAVVGPTAAGKSDLGVFLAQQLGGEVVNADSMQLYRGMDIGTAKLTLEERDGVPHHLLDIWDVTEAASVAEYQRLARAEIDRLLAAWPHPRPRRRFRPVRTGGRRRPGVPRHRPRRPGPAGSRAGRAGLRRPARPARRGRPRSGPRDPAQQRTPHRPRARSHRDHRQALHRQPARTRLRLRHRPDRRRRRPPRTGRADRHARGPDVGGRPRRRGAHPGGAGPARGPHRRPRPRLPAGPRRAGGECTEDEARAETVRATKRFARRQDSWFRRDPRVHWLSGAADHRGELPREALSLVERAVTA